MRRGYNRGRSLSWEQQARERESRDRAQPAAAKLLQDAQRRALPTRSEAAWDRIQAERVARDRRMHNELNGVYRSWESREAAKPFRPAADYPCKTQQERVEIAAWFPWLRQFGTVIRDHQEAPE